MRHLSERHRARRIALLHYARWLQAFTFGWWGAYVALRQSRRHDKAARLASLVHTLGVGIARRVLASWAEWHTARMAQRASLASRTATYRWRVQTRALWQMQHNTCRARLDLQATRSATLHAARLRVCRGVATWMHVASEWRAERRADAAADALRSHALTRACWHGLVRFHERQQHKAAQIREVSGVEWYPLDPVRPGWRLLPAAGDCCC